MEQTTQIISLTKENYAQYLPIVPIAFSVAEGGAMGYPGRVVIIDEKNNVYDFYLHELEKEDVMKVLPALYESKFGLLGYDTPAPTWKNFYLGFGNHLMVAESIYERFNEFAKSLWQSRGSLYQQWMGAVQEILRSK